MFMLVLAIAGPLGSAKFVRGVRLPTEVSGTVFLVTKVHIWDKSIKVCSGVKS